MSYKAGKRLPGETASRLGHLDVLKSELVNRLIQEFDKKGIPSPTSQREWVPIPQGGKPLSIIFGVDGSIQVIESETLPRKKLAYVKTALLRLDQIGLSQVDKNNPHPFKLRDLLIDSALYHATVFPLKHVSLPGMNIYHTIRQIIYDSIKDRSLKGEVMETLKWLAYEKWDKNHREELPKFDCPHCLKTEATLPFDAETGKCPECGGHLYITDMLGFHQEMEEDFAPETIARTYMTIHETLLLFTGIRYFWEYHRDLISECLFVKDGPLSIRAQYSKLVNPIRRFLAYTRDLGYPVHIIGQEKTGYFADHLEIIEKDMPERTLFIPSDKYIKREIQQRPENGAPYGKDTNYGVKVFVKINRYHSMVLNIPSGEFKENATLSDLIGADRIFETLPHILSYRYEGALLPIELAHGIASLSTYPSAQILKIFSETKANQSEYIQEK